MLRSIGSTLDDLMRFATGLVGPSNASDIVSEAFLSCLNSPRMDDSY